MAERRQVTIDITTKTGGATKGIKGLKQSVGGLDQSTTKATKSLGGMNKQAASAKRGLGQLAGGMGGAAIGAAGLAAGVLAVGAVLKGSIGAFAKFDDKMNQSISIMGDVSDAMRKDMSDAARSMAKTTRFSATQAAESYFFLASAGLNAKQSIAALPTVASFAQAGMFDMALATDLLTDAQSSLGLTVEDSAENMRNMTRVSDIFVKANTLANTSVQQVSEAITNKLGGALRAYNIELEEGVAVLAAYADQGLKGASAGEAFNIVLRDLKKVGLESADVLEANNIAIFDAEGNFRNMADIVGDLEAAFGGLSVAEQGVLAENLGFQARSFKNIQLLLGQSEAIREYEGELKKAGGTTQDVADKQMQSFSASMEVVKSIVTDTAITLGQELAPAVQAAAEGFGDFAIAVGEMIPATISLASWWVKLSGAFLIVEGVKKAGEAFQATRAIFDETVESSILLQQTIKDMVKSIENGEDPVLALTVALGEAAREGDLTASVIAGLAEESGASARELTFATRSALAYAEANGLTAAEVFELEKALFDQIGALGLNEKATEDLRKKYGVFRLASGLVTDGWLAGVRAADDLTDATGDLGDETDETADEVRTLADVLDTATEAQESLADAMLAFADPVFGAASAIGDLMEAEENLIEVNEDVDSTARDIAEAELQVFEATLKAQGALDKFSGANLDEQLRIIQETTGKTKEEALAFLEALGLIDGKEVTSVVNLVTNITEFRTTTSIFRKHGGPVQKGKPFVVGEAGPELFVPTQTGTIIPNNQLTATSVTNQNGVTFGDINVQSPADPIGIADAIAWRMKTAGI